MNTKSGLILPKDPFYGSLKDFLPVLPEHPAYAESSKSRIARLIRREGYDEVRGAQIQRIYGKEFLRAYRMFSQFHGVEVAFHDIVNGFFFAAAEGGEADKQALLVVGPKGGGKSDSVQSIKELLRGSEPIPYVAGCPHHCNPLNMLDGMIHLLARRTADVSAGRGFEDRAEKARADLLESLGIAPLLNWEHPDMQAVIAKNAIKDLSLGGLAKLGPNALTDAIVYGLGMPRSTRKNIGKPCPFCQEKLLGIFGESKPLAEIRLANLFFDLDDQGSKGIVDVPEVQPNNFDIGTWVGSEDLGKTGALRQPRNAENDEDSGMIDPASVSLTGFFNKGNRGIIVLTEGLKNPPEAQRVLLEQLQRHVIPLPEPLRGTVASDACVITHCNWPEYAEFMAKKVNEPYKDRFIVVMFKYPLEASEERKVGEKFWNATSFARPVSLGGVHNDPIVHDYLARLRVLSRLEPDSDFALIDKLDAYDGRDVRPKGGATKPDVREMRNRATIMEGMTGISGRETAKIHEALAADVRETVSCVTTNELRDRLAEHFRTYDDETKKKYTGFLSVELDKYWRRRVSVMVLGAFVPEFGDECQKVFMKYWDNISAYATQEPVRGTKTKADEKFMRSIESDPQFGISEAAAPRFRTEVAVLVNRWKDENKTFDVPYSVHDGLRNCIERFVLKSVIPSARLITSDSLRNEDDERKLGGAMRRLIDEFKSCEHCAKEFLEQAKKEDFLTLD